MRDNFRKCLTFTLEFEGGWSDNPRDPGGATMHGITLDTLSAALGRKARVAELRAVSQDIVAAIYHRRFWTVVGGDDLPAGVDLMAFDIAVNMGPGRALDFLNRTKAIGDARARMHALDRLRCGFWRVLRTFPVFGRGWLRRETACLHLALSM